MSHAHLNPLGLSGSTDGDNQSQPPAIRKQPAAQSFPERFLSNFFQEKNIEWLLVVGAAIVFCSSLMLVTKNWPSWPSELKCLTILGYTVATFLVAEVCRRRLNLTATCKVLHLLTLLLLPICFYSLTWLSSGTAAMAGLVVSATVFLWQASSRILDHLLRGRQTTFLISFQLLCMAAALPQLAGPVAAISAVSVRVTVPTGRLAEYAAANRSAVDTQGGGEMMTTQDNSVPVAALVSCA